jgi:prepilin-type N-terminal cleavage/methylation domain-containing protein
MYKQGFTMIELIFAIVIIAIGMLSIPVVVRSTATGQEASLFQEGISLVTAKVSQVYTYPWDENSSENNNIVNASQVLDTNGDAELNRVAGTDFRAGHFQTTLRRRMTPNSDQRPASPITNGAFSISGQNGNNVVVGVVNAARGYKKQWNVTTTVNYVSDAANYAANNIAFNFNENPSGISNIKRIQVVAQDVTPGAQGASLGVALTAYSCNIGEAEFYKRRY